MSSQSKGLYPGPQQLREAISRFLPHQGLPLLSEDRRVRWSPRLLVVCAVLLALAPRSTLGDRFDWAWQVLVDMYPSRKRPGGSYQGFIAALVARSQELLEVVCRQLRQAVQELAGPRWQVAGWICFGVDSSKFDAPMTLSNEQFLKCASKAKSWPQQLLTTIFHVGTGLPWAFVRGAATAAERQQLMQMLELLPASALLLADAGFTGYDLLQAIVASGRSFLLRVGSNVRLLTKLGYHVREHDGIVYLWPKDKQREGQPPMVLRLFRFTDSRNRVMYLLSDVLEDERLGDLLALELYRQRWGVELLYRSLKQTLERRKMLSDKASNAQAELDWSWVGLWMLGLLGVGELAETGQPPENWSAARALRAVRRAATCRRHRRYALARELAAALKDSHQRRGPKTARHWPHKKSTRPPGAPQARMATEREIQLAQELRPKRPAA